MLELHWPWLELSILLPLLGAFWVSRIQNHDVVRHHAVAVGLLTLVCTVGAWQDFYTLHTATAHDRWDWAESVLGPGVLVIDDLSAPLLPLAALMYLLTTISTLRTKVRRFSFSETLISQSILLATLSCGASWLLVGLLILGIVPPWLELGRRHKPRSVYVLHMGLFAVLLAAGWAIVDSHRDGAVPIWGVSLLMAAVLLRSGIVPVHCWMTDLFEHATFGTALLFVTPMVGAFAAVRLVLPVAPDWVLRSIALISLFTAVYAAGMALVQRETRRFFCYLFLSHSSLVLVGLETATAIGLTGALSVWLSVGMALGGFGLVLRSVEARLGRLLLSDFHGLYEQMPILAGMYLLTGLASVGFPGTIGFIGTELLIDGAVHIYPYVGVAVVLAAVLNGIAIVQVYFRLFTGARHVSAVSLRSRWSERLAVLTLAALILGGGLVPQPGIASRYQAALEIIHSRHVQSDGATTPDGGHAHQALVEPAAEENLETESSANETQTVEAAGQQVGSAVTGDPPPAAPQQKRLDTSPIRAGPRE